MDTRNKSPLLIRMYYFWSRSVWKVADYGVLTAGLVPQVVLLGTKLHAKIIGICCYWDVSSTSEDWLHQRLLGNNVLRGNKTIFHTEALKSFMRAEDEIDSRPLQTERDHEILLKRWHKTNNGPQLSHTILTSLKLFQVHMTDTKINRAITVPSTLGISYSMLKSNGSSDQFE